MLHGSSQNSLNARHKYLGAEGLADVLVNPQFKSQQFVAFGALCRQHDNGYLGISADFLADLPSVHFRHHYIQYNQGYILLFKENAHSVLSVPCFQDFKIVLYQKVAYELAHPAFVIYHQYFQSVHIHTLPFLTCLYVSVPVVLSYPTSVIVYSVPVLFP